MRSRDSDSDDACSAEALQSIAERRSTGDEWEMEDTRLQTRRQWLRAEEQTEQEQEEDADEQAESVSDEERARLLP